MKCNKCNAEWQVDASRSASITVCPFCQEKIETEKASGWKYFDNTKELLEYIAAEYGNDALFGRKYFSDHSSPMMPQGQKNLVKQAFDCGAVKIIQDNANADQAHKEIAVKQAIGKLIDNYGTSKDFAEKVIWEFTNAIGWGMSEPTGRTAPPPQPQQLQQRATSTMQPAASGVGVLMTRAWQFAEDGDWNDAADYFNKVLDADPSYAPAFLGLLCVDLKASREDKLANAEKPTDITGHKYYKRVVTDPAIKAQLDGYVQTINARIDAEQKAAAAEAERKRKAAEAAFRNKYGVLLDRLSTEGKAQAGQRRQAAQAQLDEENKKAQADVEAKSAQIKQKYDADHKAWQDEYNRLKSVYDAEYKKWEAEVTAIKSQAEQWKSQGLCPHDGGTLKGLLAKKCTECGKAPSEPIKTTTAPIQPNYPVEPRMPQTPTYTPRRLGIETDLPADVVATISGEFVFVKLGGIDWRVLTVENNRALLISEKILEKRRYNIEFKDITWEACTLRTYLNGEFYNKLGTAKSAIAETRNSNPNNPLYGTAGGNATTDKVFLLSLDEVCRYFGDSTAELRNVQKYDYYINDKNNPNRRANYGSEGDSGWWLRSPGRNGSDAALVCGTGGVDVAGHSVLAEGFVYVNGSRVFHDGGGVRPALWLNL